MGLKPNITTLLTIVAWKKQNWPRTLTHLIEAKCNSMVSQYRMISENFKTAKRSRPVIIEMICS